MIETTIFIAIFSAIVYAALGFLKSAGEDFDIPKAGATIIIGAVIGVIFYSAGIPITEQSIATQMVTYAGLIYLTENIIKAIVRKVKGK